jgi:hypothetical protein
MSLETVATKLRLRTMRLEDGEVVVPLRGWKKSLRFDSNNPHAGEWGQGIWYALIPCKRPGIIAGSVLAHNTELDPKTTDDAVLIHGSPGAIIELITKGPKKFRAMTQRRLSPEHAAKVAEATKKYRFTASPAQ